MIQEIFAQDQWIVEGSTRTLLMYGFESADIIYHLRFKTVLAQWFQLLRRHLGRDDESTIDFINLLVWVFKKRHGLGQAKGKQSFEDLLKNHTEKTIKLSSFKELNKI